MTKSEVKGISFEELDESFKNKRQNKSRFEYKDKSLLAKMGFQDSELKTPEHDKIIDILIYNDVLSKIPNKVINIQDKTFEFDSYDEWTKKEEYVIKGYNGYIIGYVDVLATIKKTLSYYEENGECTYGEYYKDNPYMYCGDCSDEIRKICRVNESSIKCSNKLNTETNCYRYSTKKLCYLKNQKECLQYNNTELKKYYDIVMFIEAKPKIDSIGELIRQVNTYREYIKSAVNEYNYYYRNACKNDYLKNEYEKRRMCMTDSFQNSSLYFIVVSPNVTDNQEKRLKEADIHIIDIKELI